MPRPPASAARGRSRTGSRADARREPVWPPRFSFLRLRWRVYARLFDGERDLLAACTTREAGDRRDPQAIPAGRERVAGRRASGEPERVAAGQQIAKRRKRSEVVAVRVEQLERELRERLHRVVS